MALDLCWCWSFVLGAFLELGPWSLVLYPSLNVWKTGDDETSHFHRAADDPAARAGPAAERPHQKLEGQVSEPPRPADLAALLRPAQVPAQRHGYFRARVVDFFRHALCVVSHGARRRADGADGHGACADEPVRRRAGGGRIDGVGPVLPLAGRTRPRP